MSGADLVLPDGTHIEDRRTATRLEVRDPQSATKPTRFISPTLPQIDEWNAEQAFRLGVMANVIAWRCIQIRAGAGAKIPLVAGRRHKDYSTIREDAPIARLLGPPPGGPARRLSARKLLRWTLAQEIATGRRAWEIETDNGRPDGRPVAFWPLAAPHLRAYPSTSGSEWFRLFEYGPAHNPVRLHPDNVFYGWDPSGHDFRQAESALQAARYDLSLVTMSDRHGIGFLQNNAVPAAIITTSKFPNEAAKRAFERSWRNEYQGPDNAGRVHVHELSDDGEGPVGDSIDVKTLGISAKDARLVEQRKDAMMEIAIALGVPWSKFDASGRTFDNADAEERTFYEETVLADLDDLEDDINMQLAPRLGDEVVWFDLRTVPALKRRRFAAIGAADMLDRGVVTPNEIRTEELELDPVEWGDEPFSPASPELPPLPTSDDGDTDGDPDTGGDPAGAAPAADERSSAPEPRQEPAQPPETDDERRARLWHATDRIVRQIESRWTQTLKRMFARQADATLGRLTGKRGRQTIERRSAPDADSIFSLEFWTSEAADLFVTLYEQVTAASLDRLSTRYDISFDLSAPWVREFIDTRANQLAGQVSQTTYQAIQGALADGVAAGESIDDIAARVRSVFTTADETRSVRIARTEVISAYNGASVAGVGNMPPGIVAAAEWIATRDSRTRDDHAAADGQVQLVGNPFNVGGIAMAHPGDPAASAEQVVNCRCTVGYLTPAEYEARRSTQLVEGRVALAMMRLVPFGDQFDPISFRRALQETIPCPTH